MMGIPLFGEIVACYQAAALHHHAWKQDKRVLSLMSTKVFETVEAIFTHNVLTR